MLKTLHNIKTKYYHKEPFLEICEDVRFINNKDFKRFKKNEDKINLPKDKKILVERISCEVNKRVLYPFIQVEDKDIAYYEFDMAIFILENIYK